MFIVISWPLLVRLADLGFWAAFGGTLMRHFFESLAVGVLPSSVVASASARSLVRLAGPSL